MRAMQRNAAKTRTFHLAFLISITCAFNALSPSLLNCPGTFPLPSPTNRACIFPLSGLPNLPVSKVPSNLRTQINTHNYL